MVQAIAEEYIISSTRKPSIAGFLNDEPWIEDALTSFSYWTMSSSRHEDDVLLYGLKDTLLHALIRWVRVELNVAKLAMERLSSIDLCDCLVIVIKGCCQIVVDFSPA
jgi:hypothetical protein